MFNVEREKFYETVEDQKVEFINGKMVFQMPHFKVHLEIVGQLYIVLDTFARLKNLGWVGSQKVLTAFPQNDFMPDLLFFENEKSVHFKKGHWKYPVPDFVAEVLAKDTENRDRGIKFDDYEAHGVQEYWIIDAEEKTVEQYFLQNGKFKLHLKSGQGRIESRVVKGFSIEILAIFDKKANLQALKSLFEK